jgi:hypothetical protein
MTGFHLPADFASQSCTIQRQELAGTLALLVEATSYPHTETLLVKGLRPARHYLSRGTEHRFCRTDAGGTAVLSVTLTGPTLLLLVPTL